MLRVARIVMPGRARRIIEEDDRADGEAQRMTVAVTMGPEQQLKLKARVDAGRCQFRCLAPANSSPKR